jgi:hypothetical protein
MRLCDRGETVVPDERLKTSSDSMRVHQLDKRSDLGIGRTASGLGARRCRDEQQQGQENEPAAAS